MLKWTFAFFILDTAELMLFNCANVNGIML